MGSGILSVNNIHTVWWTLDLVLLDYWAAGCCGIQLQHQLPLTYTSAFE